MSEQEEKRSLVKDCEFITDKDGEINLSNVEKQTIDISHIFYYWGTKCAQLREYNKQLQLDFDIFIAIKKQEALVKKTQNMTPSEAARFKKDISGTAAKELVITMYETEYREKLNAIFSCERKVEELEKSLKAIDMKAFALGSIASTLRKEYNKVQ